MSRFWRPAAITILPLTGFVFEQSLAEPLSGIVQPTLYTLYVVCLIAFGVSWVGAERWSSVALPVAAGALGVGSAVVGVIAVFGSPAALFGLLISLAFPGELPASVLLAVVIVSLWFTSITLAKFAVDSLRASRRRIGIALTFGCAIVGVTLTIALMAQTKKADASWLAPRLQVFDADDIGPWEKSLSEIKGRWLCGHRRCLLEVCFRLMGRFGEGDGESGPFASPRRIAVVAPNVPHHLAVPIEKVYGYPVRQVCVIGD